MTIKECIDIVDNLKPNQYSIEDKVGWLAYLDHSIIEEVLFTHEGYDGRYDDFTGYSADRLTEGLVVPSPYDRLYPAYLKMKIDEENGETARYNNSATLFNAYLMEYKKWYNKRHMPISPSDRRSLPTLNPPYTDVPQEIPRPVVRPIDVSEAQLEQLRKLLYAELRDDMLEEVSDDKLYDIVKEFVDNNAQMLNGKDGRDGVDGKDGDDGKDGLDGADGVGIQKAWVTDAGELKITLTSGVTTNLGVVKGEKGDRGERGMEGAKGDKGDRGEKGEKGNQGERGYTGQQGIQGVKGEDGSDGKSAYEYALDGGFEGTEAEFIQLLGVLSEERIDELVGRLVASKKSKVRDVVLRASAWVEEEDELYTQVVEVAEVTENSQVILLMSMKQIASFRQKDHTFGVENEGGKTTFGVIGQKPQNDYTFQIQITEVDYE